MAVCTIDTESLSKIAIHNLEKSWKIEIRIAPYGQKPKNWRPGVYL